MGLFATLRHPLACPRCGDVDEVASQFRLGACAEMPVYRLGEMIDWDSPRARFGPREASADGVCVGYPNPCVACGLDRVTSVVLRGDRFVEARHRHGYGWEPEDVLVGPERRGLGEVLRGSPWRLPRGRATHEELHLEWAGDRLSRVRGRVVEPALDYLSERDPERMFALGVFWWLWSEGAYFELDAERDEDGRLLLTLARKGDLSLETLPEVMHPFAAALDASLPWNAPALAESLAGSSRGPLLWALSQTEVSDEARSRAARSFELVRHEAQPMHAALRETLRTLRYALEFPFVR